MKKAVVYYSYSGKTKTLATELAARESADVIEVKGAKRVGKLKAYTAGIVASIRGKAWPIEPLSDMGAYDHLHLMAPVWAGNPAPAMYAALNRLPAGKRVSVAMVSMSGNSDCRARVEGMIKNRGSEMVDFTDVKA